MRSAAGLYGFEEYEPEVVEVTLPRGRRAKLRGIDVVVHDSNRMPPAHRTVLDSIPVTTVARTLCDLTAVRPRWAVERVIDTALMRRLTTRERIEVTFSQLAGRGRRRCTIMREILDARDPQAEVAESPGERRIAQLLVEAGLPRPRQQHEVHIGHRVHRLDLAYPEQRIAIEYDGWATHATRSAFDSDRVRQNRLSLAGWRFLRFTSSTSDEMIVRDVSHALELVSAMRDICA
jgi:very-short-patch-repair endonuclease